MPECSKVTVVVKNGAGSVQTESLDTFTENFDGENDETQDLPKVAHAEPVSVEEKQQKKPVTKRKYSHGQSFQDELPPPKKRARKTEVERLQEVTQLKEFTDVFSLKRGNRRSMDHNKLNVVAGEARSTSKIRGRVAETASKGARPKRSSI